MDFAILSRFTPVDAFIDKAMIKQMITDSLTIYSTKKNK